MKELRIKLDDTQLRTLFSYFDEDHSGDIDFDEFISALRDPLSKRRHALVQLAWDKIDMNSDGDVDIQEIGTMYDVSQHPDVIAGKATPEKVLKEFLGTFEARGNHDGRVSRAEFEDYYTNLSANID
eukprot:CAMPEP_0182430102 /NCGR_PEP_ID=MMETSP1167-20130531/36871_1 /TAXON_ID=2988 /ORGANISM="Mallomonas Sp, Strain CCMP3275" /LENGTH=126 /DNA_ID=CAMNT_0024614767 /DNA_START=416 /DNA_END=793 /DNA_ORIENTATION=+